MNRSMQSWEKTSLAKIKKRFFNNLVFKTKS